MKESSAATAAMVNLVASLGQELAQVLEGVEACDLRQQVDGIAQLFEVTERMVRVTGWNAEIVLPTLQTLSAVRPVPNRGTRYEWDLVN